MSHDATDELPVALANWIAGLAFGKKRSYAEAYARAMLNGVEPPASPSYAHKDWPTRTRKRVEQLLRDSTATFTAAPTDLPKLPWSSHSVADTDPHWSTTVDITDPKVATSTLNQLVPGLRDIGEVEIPYHRLPRRAATRYSGEFKTWSQIGNVTVYQLMSRRGAGRGTVTALLQTALDSVQHADCIPLSDPSDASDACMGALQAALTLVGTWWSLFHDRPLRLSELLQLDRSGLPTDVASALGTIATFEWPRPLTRTPPSEVVHQLLNNLNDREIEVLTARIWTWNPSTLEAIAGRFEVTRERVRQIQSKAQAKLRLSFTDAADRSVAWYANEVACQLGPYIPLRLAEEVLASIGVDVPSLEAQVLLYLAGPYTLQGNGWLENVQLSGADLAARAVDMAFNICATPSTSALMDALQTVNIKSHAAEEYLSTQASLKRFDNTWVRWCGGAIDKAHTALLFFGNSATAETINELISEGHSVATLKNGMSSDSRFVRTGKRTWGLREWGVEEYSGIVEEILERIDASGGSIGTDELTKDLVSAFPDIAENSVKIYLNTLAFVVEGRTVRRRNDSDGWPDMDEFKHARGAFRRSDNEVRLAVTVTRDVLRGSGFAIHPAVAKALGVLPGGRRTFTSPDGSPAVVNWRLWSTNGPDIGSVRPFATSTNAEQGDTLVLIFNLDENVVDAVNVPKSATSAVRLGGLFGVQSKDDLETTLAAGLGCRPSELRSILRDRGDGDVSELIPVAADARLENEIANVIAELA